MQMGFGGSSRSYVGYYENFSEAPGTNGACDVSVMDASELLQDLLPIGFEDFNSYIRPTGPGDFHKNWLFFNAKRQ